MSTGSRGRSRWRVFFCLVALAASASAQPEDPGSRLTLAEAVERTLRNSYELQRAAATVDEREGRLQELSGLFDRQLFVDAGFREQRFEVIGPQLGNEIRRRVPLEFVALGTPEPPGALDRAADGIIANLEGGDPASQLQIRECFDFESLLVVDFVASEEVETPPSSDLPVAGRSDSVVICLDQDGIPTAISGQVGQYDLVQLQNTLDTVQGLSEILGDQIGDELQDTFRQIEEEIVTLLRGLARDFRLSAEIFRQQRARLGDLPEEAQLLDFRFELGYRMPYRNGLALTTSFRLAGTEDNFADKPRIPALGDSLAPNTFTGSLGLSLDVPLGKGRGRIATAGPELASAAAVRAERQLWVFTASREALATTQAYWSLAAQQERLEYLQQSLDVQDRIFESTRSLVDAGELPAVELNRTEARRAEVASRIAGAERALVDARLALVEAMGQSTQRIEQAPLAADGLPPEDLVDTDLERWIDRALEERRDLLAASEAVHANDILRRSARANLRRRVDLVLSTSYSGFHESFEDRFYDFDGYWEALSGEIAGPTYRAALRFSLPVRNRTARGQLAQAEASLSQSRIEETDLERRIRLTLHELVVAIERKRTQLERLRENVRYLEESYQGATDRYRIGDVTLIDLLTTEQQLTDARLAMVGARRDLADLVTQLLFEAGALLVGEPDPADFDPTSLELAPTLEGP